MLNRHSNSRDGIRCLVVANYGIGNVIMLLPLLTAAARRLRICVMFSTDHPLLHDRTLLRESGLGAFDGFVKPLWRRFLPEDRRALFAFLRREDVRLVLNLRLEAPAFDPNYFDFKAEATARGLTCWDLHEFGLSQAPCPVATKIERMLRGHGMAVGPVRRDWLHEAFRRPPERVSRPHVAIHTGASQSPKRWPLPHWRKVLAHLLATYPFHVSLFGGISPEEQDYARAIYAPFAAEADGRCELIVNRPIGEVFERLAAADLILTHDTFVSHLAAACGIPAIVLYTVTDGRIWRPLATSPFFSIQSKPALQCPNMKPDGTCTRYYDACELTCSTGVKVADVVHRIAEAVGVLRDTGVR
jgi:ADP-heptose:LPS heptosyltransferase